ncbi:MAG TPA: tripartite tricarboxylate transporter substrate binding protein [Alphaproteobacteria bacterium]
MRPGAGIGWCCAVGTLVGLWLTASSSASGQVYPNRPVKIVVPHAPGGAVDAVGRLMAQKLSEELGQRFVVENRAGASGNIGSEFVAHATPDGYTLLVNASILVLNPFVFRELPFDPVRDLAPISLIASGPLLFVTRPDFPADSVKEFIAKAKSKQGEVTFATSGLGSAGHFAEEMFKLMAGVDMLTVVYKGSGPALLDVMNGQVNAMMDPILSTLPLVRDGRLKALGVTSASRSVVVPDIPTVAESGLANFEFFSWYGIWAPARTSPDVVNKLEAQVAKIVQMPDVGQRLTIQGFEPVGSSAEEFSVYIKDEMAKYAKLVQDAGLKFE